MSGRVRLAPGALALGLFDAGRRALVLNGRTGTLSLVDLASAQVVAERALPERPDQLSFTREFAYVRSQGSANLQLIALQGAREGRLEGPSVPMGRSAPDEAPEAINVASVLAPAPEGNGVLLANPGDGSIYRYAQGLMVPINSHSNYRRRARGLLVFDSSLQERRPGEFEAPARVARSGRYDLVVRNLRPALTACFTVALDGTEPPAQALAAQQRPVPRLLATRRAADDALQVEFDFGGGTASAAISAADVPEDAPVTVLLVQRHGPWQARAPARALGQGRYQAQLHGLRGLPPGELEALVESPARHIAYAEGRLGRIAWPLAPATPATPAAPATPTRP